MRLLKHAFLLALLPSFFILSSPFIAHSAEVALLQKTFVRGTATPFIENASFDVPAPAESYRILITNGRPDGTDRCSSASITLNGSLIVDHFDLNKQVGFLERSASRLNVSNLLSAELESTPGCIIGVQIIGVDNTAPQITISYPVQGQILPTPQITVTGTINDPDAVITVNGVNAANAGSSYQAPITLNYSTNSIIAIATDFYGNSANASVQVVMDNQAPVITLDPTPMYISATTIELKGNIQDLTATTVTVPGKSVSLPSGGGPFSFVIDLIEGMNTLTVRAEDSAQNSSEASRVIIRDTMAPTVVISSPLAGSYIGAHTTNVSGSVTDVTPVHVTVNGVDAAMNGSAFTLASLTLAEGSNTVRAVATDAAGNTGTAEVTVFSDTVPPVVVIETPANNLKTNVGTQTASGTVTDASPIESVALNGSALTLNAGRFSHQHTLIEGPNTITVEAADMAGNRGSASISLNLDTVPPPPPSIDALPAVTNLTILTVSGNAEPQSLVRILGRGEAHADTSGRFTMPIALDLNITNSLSATATDDVGNESGAASFSVIQDSLAPVITLDSTPAYVSSTTLELRGSVQDLTATTVLVQGKSVSIPAGGGAFSIIVDLLEGGNTLTVKATDSAGNTAEASRSLTLDTIPPVVHILAPAPNVYINKNSADVSGTVTDATPVTLTINGINVLALTGDSFTLSSLSLSEGANIIRAVATDAAGNTGSDEIMVISDTIAPVVTIDHPTNGIKTNTISQTISGGITDASPIQSAEVNGNALSL
ncbi:MAG: Ig-like domain-containing protein, partial [bacterium]